MSRRAIFRLSLAFLACSLLAIVLAGAWLLGTTSGVRWVLRSIPEYTGIEVEAGSVSGRFWDEIILRELRIELEDRLIRINRLYFRSLPVEILTGRIAMAKISARGVVIEDRDHEEKGPAVFAWPPAEGILSMIHVRIDVVSVEGIEYLRTNDEPWMVKGISARVEWDRGKLVIADLQMDSGKALVSGQMEASLNEQDVSLDLAASFPEPWYGILSASARFRTGPSGRPDQVQGHVSAGIERDGGDDVTLSGSVLLAGNTLDLTDMVLSRKGGKGEVRGNGRITFTETAPDFTVNLELSDLDLIGEIRQPTLISGTLSAAGSVSDYEGRFSLVNRAATWRSAELAGTFGGNTRQFQMEIEKGILLGGEIKGMIEGSWDRQVFIAAQVEARSMDTGIISPEWAGLINMDISGRLAAAGDEPLKATVSGDLFESRFLGREVSGHMEARVRGRNVILEKVELAGKGFEIMAEGELEKRISYILKISDVGVLVPGGAGMLDGSGWISRENGDISVLLGMSGRGIRTADFRIEDLTVDASIGSKGISPVNVRAALRAGGYGRLMADSATLEVNGTVEDHVIKGVVSSGKSEMSFTSTGKYEEGEWQGVLTSFASIGAGPAWALQSPARLFFSRDRFDLHDFLLRGEDTEEISIGVSRQGSPSRGHLKARWQNVNLERSNIWLKDISIRGQSSGSLDLQWEGGAVTSILGEVALSGSYRDELFDVGVQNSRGEIIWDGRELRSKVHARMIDGGILTGSFSSPDSPLQRVALTGEFEITSENIDLTHIRSFLPAGLQISGVLNGNATGKLFQGSRFEMEGTAGVTSGTVDYTEDGSKIQTELTTAQLSWTWANEALAAEFSCTLSGHGELGGSIAVPVSARFPVAIDKAGPVSGAVRGRVSEKGLLSAVIPGVVQETEGEIDLDLKMEGIWEAPRFSGNLGLKNAGASIPMAGIRLEDVQAEAHVDRDLLRLDRLFLKSGSGNIAGSGEAVLRNGKLISYEGSIDGDNFQAVYLPEYQLFISPRLRVEGTPEKVAVRGEITVPELIIAGQQKADIIEPSDDVQVVDAPKGKKELPFSLDLNLRIGLGDRIFLRTAGIRARLEGNLVVMGKNISDPAALTGDGQIVVKEGSYRGYNTNLDISRGRIIFSGGPVDNPALDIRAVRTAGSVKAGVMIEGTAKSPVVSLYSEPQMPDSDVLAYMVLGHPLGQDGSEASLVLGSAGLLMAQGDSGAIQEGVKDMVGLDVLAIESAGDEDASTSVLTLGKYLTPDLYLSFGQSLKDEGDIFRLRYRLSKKWQVEGESGIHSGTDIFYTIDLR